MKEKIKTEEGEWNLERGEARSQPIIDPFIGQDRVIRQFAVQSPPGSSFSGEEVLAGVLPLLKKNVIKDGWTFAREPEIVAAADGFIVITVLRPALKLGMIIGATDASPRNASRLLLEAGEKTRRRGKKYATMKRNEG